MSEAVSAAPADASGAAGIAWADDEVAGELRLSVGHKNGRSYAREQYHRGALRILRPHYADASGQVGYTVINPGGGYLGSDAYEIDLTVDAGASLLLTTQSATKVYRTPQGPATQRMRIELGDSAVLESIPDQLIVYREGSYRQRTDVRMHPRASLLLAEVVTPGWDPAGAEFGYDELRLRTSIHEVTDGGTRLWVLDQLRIVPGGGAVTGIGFMEGHSHVGQLLVADARVDDELVDAVADLAAATGLRCGISRIGRPRPRTGDGDDVPGLEGFALRTLAQGTEDITALHVRVADLLRGRWRGQTPLQNRKY